MIVYFPFHLLVQISLMQSHQLNQLYEHFLISFRSNISEQKVAMCSKMNLSHRKLSQIEQTINLFMSTFKKNGIKNVTISGQNPVLFFIRRQFIPTDKVYKINEIKCNVNSIQMIIIIFIQISKQIKREMELNIYQNKQLKDPIIQKEEYGTFVEKDKKKKKKKKNKLQKDNNKEIDQQKIKENAKESQLHKVDELTPEEKIRYSEAQNHPLKLICSNLPFKITAEELFQYFNTLISSTNPELANPPPIKDVEFDKARTFAILTVCSRRIKDFFRSHSQLTYIEGTTTFKIHKARQFFAQRYLKKKQDALKNAGSDNKIYLGSLPLSFNDQQVRKICETFGKIKFFNLVKDGSISKGYAFFEYQDPMNIQKAIKSLNGLPVADKRLKCHPATIGNKGLSLAFTPSTINNVGLQQVDTKPSNHSFGSFLLSYENIIDHEVQLTLKHEPLCKTPSRVVQFLNMFYPQDLFDEEMYEDLVKDVQQECVKYGPIEKVVVPRPDPICGYSCPTVGKVFVKFMYIIHAKRARLGISGRVYNKRTVVASFYPEQKFNLKEYLVSI